MTMSSFNDRDDPRDPATAAWWFARWHSGELTRRDRRAFARWRRDHPERAREFDRMQQLGAAAAGLPRDQVESLLGGPVPARPGLRSGWRSGVREGLRAGVRRSQRQFALRAAFACAGLAAVALGVWWSLPVEAPTFTAAIRTERGERRQLTLPDGSVLDINGGTQARVLLYAARRDVVLDSGEINFTVSPDAARPFIVDAGSGVVRVTGTVFDVRRDANQVAVLVESGTVQVSGGHWWNLGHAVLRAGHGIRVPGSGAIGVPAPADVQTATAWRDGRVVFKNATLTDVVSEMNRYLATPLRLSDDKAGRLRVSASFTLDRPEALVDALPSIAPVRMTPHPGGPIDIQRRQDDPSAVTK
ncbi:FecR family protein [Achromobacter kerstersii]|uniref:FecR family protein n=1 Tax=Achromobacter kerstersii TaxID=1353890 RepID=UPI0006C452B8|nr:FecR domain-containing protein [Achromobacter kerstersii]CUI88295.1 fec operon regulator FecR [Achromobacter kerstersii]